LANMNRDSHRDIHRLAEALDFLLVNTPFVEHNYSQSPQLGMLYVAASLDAAGFSVGVLDQPIVGAERLVEAVRRHQPRVLGFHVTTDSLARIRRAIGILRSEGIEPPLIIFGGPHVTIEDESLLQSGCGRIIVRGEGEDTVVEIARWWFHREIPLEEIKGITYLNDDHELIRNVDRSFVEDLDRLPFPDRRFLLTPQNPRTYEIITGRGCPFHCAFCAEGLAGFRYRFRSPESVMREIRDIVEDNSNVYLGILDDTFLVDRQRVEKIANALLAAYGPTKRVVWFCEGRVDFIVNNADLFPLLRDAGLVRVQIGLESGNQQVLDSYQKGIRLEQVEDAVSILRDAGIPSIYGNFIVGGAFETRKTIEDSISFARHLINLAPGRMECSASMLALYPGTAMAENPGSFGLHAVDPKMRRCLSIQHPVAETNELNTFDILQAFHQFNQEVWKEYESALPQVPMTLIRQHLDLVKFGLTTRWAGFFLRYSCIQTFSELTQIGYHSLRAIPPELVLSAVPRRTMTVLETDGRQFQVTASPRKIVFNEMAGRIFESASGKLSVREIIEDLRQTIEFLPPEPILTEHVVEALQDMEDRFLVVFSNC